MYNINEVCNSSLLFNLLLNWIQHEKKGLVISLFVIIYSKGNAIF
jgi:hypothetical protein